MQCYTELLPPTAVSHALALPFLSANATNLLTVATSLLRVYGIQRVGDTSKLSLVGEYPLAGTVTSVAAVKLLHTRSGGHAALLAFRNAKLSLVEWDAANHRISTISIHYYEGDNVIEQPFGPGLDNSEAYLTVDPSSRCAALKFGARHLAILPLRQHSDELGDNVDEDFTMGGVSTSAAQLGPEQSLHDQRVDTPPYKPSFVLPTTAIDPNLVHPVDVTFLHDYREPTFGILSSPRYVSLSMLGERKDCLTYSVFTLDLEQRASTNLVTVSKLPSDLWKMVPLQAPVGGALMVGHNAFVHIDQSGKVNAVAVNEFAKVMSDFGMFDQSDLDLRLEGCEVEVLDASTGDLLVVLNDGNFCILRFQILGRNVGGIQVLPVSIESGGHLLSAAPSVVVPLTDHLVFVGSEDGPSALVRWSTDVGMTDKKRSHAQMLGQDDEAKEEVAEEDMEDIDEDDLYAPASKSPTAATTAVSSIATKTCGKYTFAIHDELQSLGPINNICLGRSSVNDDLELMAGIGRGRGSWLAQLSRAISLKESQTHSILGVKSIWSICANSLDFETRAVDDNLAFVYDGAMTAVYDISAGAEAADESHGPFHRRNDTDFEEEGETLRVAIISNGSRIVQCRSSELRIYDHDLGLTQIIPMLDEETDTELKITDSSFDSQYILLIRDDSTLQVLKADKSGDVEPLDLPDAVAKQKWLSGCLYTGLFTSDQTCAFLLDQDGGMHVFQLPDLHECYHAVGIPHLPPIISMDVQKRRVGAKATLTEILVADLGVAELSKPYLIFRSSLDDLTLYEPFHYSTQSATNAGSSCLRFRKVPSTYLQKYDDILHDDEYSRPRALQSFNIGTRKVVCISGSSPALLVKEPTSLPKVLPLRTQKIVALSPLRRGSEQKLLLADDNGELRECDIDRDTQFATGWSVLKMQPGSIAGDIRFISYHEGRDVYIAATCHDVDFHFPEDEIKYQDAEDIKLRPQVPQYNLHLMLARQKEVISTVRMPALETITAMRVMQLEISEHSREQRSVLVVGSAAMHGEDRPARGTLTVFDIIDVVPEVNRPETGIRLKCIAREETKGAVTAIEQFPGGLLGTVQGQKIMIRGLKEDGSCLPVAFLDALCHMGTLKTIGHSGMWLVGDVWKGIWFGGFTEEPYRLSLLGKSRTHLEVMYAEFLPFDQQLFIIVMDADTNLHVLQYDPENPKSLAGARLLHRGAFHVGHFPTSMTLLPSSHTPFAGEDVHMNDDNEDGELPTAQAAPSLYHILVTTQTGSIGLVTPVDETTYRRLAAVQTSLTSVLEHGAGLNPRAYRAATLDGSSGGVGEGAASTRSGIIDGSLIQRISELGTSKRAEVLDRAGGDVWGMRNDLEIMTGTGLAHVLG